MIALNGANGAVMGSFTDDFSSENEVQLIAHDALKTILSSIYQLPTPSLIRKEIRYGHKHYAHLCPMGQEGLPHSLMPQP